jgi:hypothetical protein
MKSLLRGNSPSSACEGKTAYRSAKKAHRALARQSRRKGGVKPASAARGNVHVYRCNYCHEFHIGSTTR